MGGRLNGRTNGNGGKNHFFPHFRSSVFYVLRAVKNFFPYRNPAAEFFFTSILFLFAYFVPDEEVKQEGEAS